MRVAACLDMQLLDRLIPAPGLMEIDEIELALPLERAWDVVRHIDLGRSRLIRALFDVRTLPGRLTGEKDSAAPSLRLDAMTSSESEPGFQILAVEPPLEVAVGAIGKVWQLDIPFVHVPTADGFAAFSEPGYVRVAWALRLSPLDERHTSVSVELRVDATDEESWKKFREYFRLIGPASRFIRRSLLAGLAREYADTDSKADDRSMPGDELLPDAPHEMTHGITIHARPEAIWPWLVQMGCRRAGFYSWDLLDNAGKRSAREIHPGLQSLAVGDVIPATPKGQDGFEVLRVDAPKALVLGGLFDTEGRKQLAFHDPRPGKYWHVTWSFALEPLDENRTRLRVRARAACPTSERVHLSWIRLVHPFMEDAQLRHLAARVEGRLPKSDWRDVIDGLSGVAVMAAAFFTPFFKGRRSHWGLSEADAAKWYAGDDLVARPLWSFTHAVDVDARTEDVWPWVSQIGADKGGFYSYQALENLAGCGIRNAETVHPEWEVRVGDNLSMHPKMPSPKVVSVERGRYFVAHAPADQRAREQGRPWTTMSWLFLVEPKGNGACRVISRFRADCSDDLVTELSFGPALLEPIGFAMDRRMLQGIKERAEVRET
jgi:hypothetical protein